MRVEIASWVPKRFDLLDVMEALHDGLFDGDVQGRPNSRQVRLLWEEDELDIRVKGSGFAFRERGGDVEVLGGTIRKFEIRDAETGRLAATFDKTKLSLKALDETFQRMDRGDLGGKDGQRLWDFLFSGGVDHASKSGRGADFGSSDGFQSEAFFARVEWRFDGRDRITLTDADERFLAGDGADRVKGEGGDDRLDGEGGNDKLDGGKGNDTLFGGDGNDRLDGGKGRDHIEGGDGNDRIDGGDQNDVIVSGDGKDKVDGGKGDDEILDRRGNSKLDGGKGNDTIHGGDGADRIDGGDGNDTLDGAGGNDRILGGKGDDFITDDVDNYADDVYPGSFDDRMDGGSGNDTLRSFAGDDVMTGGSGADRFEIWFDPDLVGGRGSGTMSVRITDYGRGADTIHIDNRALTAFRTASREDDDWWTAFFTEGDRGAVFESDGLRVEVDGLAATEDNLLSLF